MADTACYYTGHVLSTVVQVQYRNHIGYWAVLRLLTSHLHSPQVFPFRECESSHVTGRLAEPGIPRSITNPHGTCGARDRRGGFSSLLCLDSSRAQLTALPLAQLRRRGRASRRGALRSPRLFGRKPRRASACTPPINLAPHGACSTDVAHALLAMNALLPVWKRSNGF